jgi:tmRNA-binding protein
MRWKSAYIAAFNAMEAQLRGVFVLPRQDEGAQRMREHMKLRTLLMLRDQSNKTLREVRAEQDPEVQLNLYFQFRFINDTLGIPTKSAELLLGADALTVLALRRLEGA